MATISDAGLIQLMRGRPQSAQVDPEFAALRSVELLRSAPDNALATVIGARMVHRLEVPRDTIVEPPELLRDVLCFVVSGQISIGVFTTEALAERGRRQRDATLGETDGTLMPPGPLARTARTNLAMFGSGELFNLAALPEPGKNERVLPFSLGASTVVLIAADAVMHLSRISQPVEIAIGRALALTNARLRAITGIKHEILDFYLRNGLSVAGPMVRLRQLDLCIDCKQCEDACEDRHGARRLTLGGYELGLVDVVFSCRTCTDARCLSPCEHDAIKRDPKSGEIQIVEDRCIGCSLCALSCPYGAIDMINVAEVDSPSYAPEFKARLDRGGKLGFGPGKGRKAPARRIANKCDHCAGYGEQACVSACPTGALVEVSPASLFEIRATKGRRNKTKLVVLPETPFIDGLGIVDSGTARVRHRALATWLWILGIGAFAVVCAEIALRWYRPTWSASYHLELYRGTEHGLAELAVSYLAGSTLALACGYVGTALMLLSMAYPLQRRFGWFYRTATNQFWLDVHLMTGTVGPLFILLHSALRLSTWVSIPFWSMAAVVVSGVIGRYLYTLVPSLTSRNELANLEHRRRIAELATGPAAAYANDVLAREARRSEEAWEVGLVILLAWVLVDDVRRIGSRFRDRLRLRRLAPRTARELAYRLDRVVRFERRTKLAPRGKALLKSWKRVHVPFSVALLVTTVVHVAIELLP